MKKTMSVILSGLTVASLFCSFNNSVIAYASNNFTSGLYEDKVSNTSNSKSEKAVEIVDKIKSSYTEKINEEISSKINELKGSGKEVIKIENNQEKKEILDTFNKHMEENKNYSAKYNIVMKNNYKGIVAQRKLEVRSYIDNSEKTCFEIYTEIPGMKELKSKSYEVYGKQREKLYTVSNKKSLVTEYDYKNVIFNKGIEIKSGLEKVDIYKHENGYLVVSNKEIDLNLLNTMLKNVGGCFQPASNYSGYNYNFIVNVDKDFNLVNFKVYSYMTRDKEFHMEMKVVGEIIKYNLDIDFNTLMSETLKEAIKKQ